jgi:methionyl-tRNA formyltransferase
VKQKALELGLPVETPLKCRDPEFVQRLRDEEADVILVAAYGQILSEEVLCATKRGGINLHASILPKYRGAAPIQRAILNGETKTGVTLMQMDKGLDTGDIIDIARTPIGPDETYGELQERLARMAAELSVKWMPRIVAGEYPRTPQNHEEATLAPKVNKEEAQLSFYRSAREEYNRFRAFTPKPGAFLETRFGTLKLLEIRPLDQQASPGEVIETSPEWVIGFVEGAMSIRKLQPAGKKPMSGKDFVNGAHIRHGITMLVEHSWEVV